jgi:ankyrin repeat protein
VLKKDIKAIFQAIRHRSLADTQVLLAAKPELLHAHNFAPPKKDDGQSTLQVAFKIGQFDIARFLIEQGADLHFMEESALNRWRAPVIHDCLRAVLFNTYTVQKDLARFEEALALLQSLLNSGVSANSADSFGTTCLVRALADARQMIEHPYADIENGILLTQLRRVFQVLLAAGADPDLASEKGSSANQEIEFFELEKYGLLEG